MPLQRVCGQLLRALVDHGDGRRGRSCLRGPPQANGLKLAGRGGSNSMAKILLIATHGSDDPTRAGLPFVAAEGAMDAGHEASLDLSREAVWLMRDTVAENAKGVGWPTVKELLGAVIAAGVRIHV